MCIIQAAAFTRNGSVEWGSCNLSPSDNLSVDIMVQFLAGETGTMDCFAYVTPPGGTPESHRITQTVYSPTTVDFIYDFPNPLQTGTYRFGKLEVWNRETGTLLCEQYL